MRPGPGPGRANGARSVKDKPEPHVKRLGRTKWKTSPPLKAGQGCTRLNKASPENAVGCAKAALTRQNGRIRRSRVTQGNLDGRPWRVTVSEVEPPGFRINVG